MSQSIPLNPSHSAPRTAGWPPLVIALLSRVTLFAFWQAVIAEVFTLQAQPAPWETAVAWWPVSAVLANLTCLVLLTALQRRDGLRLFDLYRVERHSLWREVLLSVALMAVGTPLALLPNILLGNALFGDVQQAGELLFRPLPLWALLPCMILFPLTNALTELPTYFGYVRPRLLRLSGHDWAAVIVPALFLAAQHLTLPLIFDGRFLLWRLGMFLPFAVFVGYCLHRRPRLLPYWMVLHALMDLQFISSVLAVSS